MRRDKHITRYCKPVTKPILNLTEILTLRLLPRNSRPASRTFPQAAQR